MIRPQPSFAPAAGLVRLRSLVLVALLSALTASAAGAVTITWNNPAGGAWSDPANWTPAEVPDAAGETAVLPVLSGPYRVTLDINPAADRIDIAAGDPTLDLNGHSVASVALVQNAGRIENFVGYYDSQKLRNLSTGTVAAAANATVDAGGTLWTDGRIIVGPGASSRLSAQGSLQLSGNGALILNQSTIYDPNGDQGSPITVLAGATLSGSGVVSKRLYNYGMVECDGAWGPTLRMDTNVMNYGGTIRVSHGGTINVNRPLVQNRGIITSGEGGGSFTLLLTSGNLGTIDLMYGGRIVVNGGDLSIACLQMYEGVIQRVGSTGTMNISIGTLQNMTIDTGAEVKVTDHIDFMAAGQSLTNKGTLRVAGSINFGILNSPDSIWIKGGGVVQLEGGTLGSGTGGYLVNAKDMTIQGCGTINPPFVNEGVVNVDCGEAIGLNSGTWINGNLLRVRSGKLVVTGAATVLRNRGLISADVGTSVERGATIDNTGGVIAANGSARFTLGYGTTSGSIVGGRLDASGTGTFYVQTYGTLRDVTIGPTGVLQTVSGGTTTLAGARLTNQGTVRVLGTGRMVAGATTDYLQTAGVTSLEGGTIGSTRDVRIQGGELRGIGTVAANLVSGGVVGPDPGTAGIRVQGNYTQLATGSFRVPLGGQATTQYGRLAVTGNAALDGSLVPSLINGYAPATGDAFDVLSYGSRSGQFAQLAASSPSAPIPDLTPIYNPASLSLVTGGTVSVDGAGKVPATLRFYGRSGSRGASFVLDLPWTAEVKGRLYDAAGREVARLADGSRSAGSYVFAINRSDGAAQGLPSGIYFARFSVMGAGANEVRNARVVVLR
jgi:adhesin HecA-like repeat protein